MSKNFVRHSPCVLAAAIFSNLSLQPQVAEAGSQGNIANIENYKALGADPQFKWAGAVTAYRASDGNVVTASCVAVAPTVVVGAGHFTPGPTSLSKVHTVTFGANYKLGPRLTLEVDRWERFPGYITGNTNTTDLGVYYLKEAIPNFTPVNFGDIPLGAIAVQVDYGNRGDLNTGELPSLGDKLGGRGRASEAYRSSSTYPELKYALLNFDGTGSAEPTQALQFSSGAGWFYNGKIVGISIAAPLGQLDSVTTVLRLNTDEVQSFLQPRIQASWAALPASYFEAPGIGIDKAENRVTLTWSAKASGCILEISLDLKNWQTVITSPRTRNIVFGAGSSTFTGDADKQFFRQKTP